MLLSEIHYTISISRPDARLDLMARNTNTRPFARADVVTK
jgi:hypothetical protein